MVNISKTIKERVARGINVLSIQEIVDKTKPQLKQIEDTMDHYGFYHPDTKTPEHTKASLYDGLSLADQHEIQETLRSIPLHEFLAKSGTTGIAGAYYLVPTKVHDELISYSRLTDACPLIGHVVTGWPGGDLQVDIVNDETFKAQPFTSGGQISTETVETVAADLVPQGFGISPKITNDLIEDANFSMIEFHLQRAAMACGDEATSRALTVLLAPPDGWGTAHATVTGDANETKLTGGTTTDIILATRLLGNDRWIADTMVTTPEAWGNSISMQIAPTGWDTFPPTEGYTNKIGQLDVLQLTNAELHASTDVAGAVFTDCETIVFSRENALLTGRKRWLQVSNYSDPVKDLSGCTVTCRQDSVTLYKDASYKITET